MASMKCIPGLLVVIAVSTWTTAEDLRTESSDVDGEDDADLSVSEQLERANKDLDEIWHGIVVQGDIAIPPNPTLRNADPCVRSGCKWPKANDGNVYVPYVIANHYTPKELTVINRALESFSSSTCIRFIPSNGSGHYLHIKSIDGCFSFVGYNTYYGDAQPVSLRRQGCIYYGTIQHELLHALGFNHEQCRSDRDNHIRILLENIAPGMRFNFKKIKTLNQGTPYDFSSVMQYQNMAFSKNRKATMVAIHNPNLKFGNAKQMSQNDIKRINVLYGCKNELSNPSPPMFL